MRPLLMGAGVGVVLGLALPSALAQETGFRRGEAVETGASRFVSVNRQRELEHERLKLEAERRGLDQRHRNAERSAREARRGIDAGIDRLRRDLSAPREEQPKDGEVVSPSDDPGLRVRREFALRRLKGDRQEAETRRRRLEDLGRQLSMERRRGGAAGRGSQGLRRLYLKSLR
ncbi:MAG: hypothetical protein IIC54_07995 [Proteobacteria bacterium]|nr:hypothetical protein [Pseudomonadota bacterium]MCH8213998.1 hypothetical protein [Pseudomonadota bacterium]